MKVFGRIKSTLWNIQKSIKRFPITIGISTILAIFLIYLNESHLAWETKEKLDQITLVLGLGIPLSLFISLGIERFFEKNKLVSTILYCVGAGFLLLYYFIFLEDNNTAEISRYIGTMIFCILGFLYISRIGKNKDYEYYIMDIYYSFVLTFVYSFVLYFGLSAIFFTIDQLFDANVPVELYYYMFLIVFFIFAISLFLSKLPYVDTQYEEIEYGKPLTILLTYIVIPLITIYTIILYIYFGKILLTRIWPRGLVSHLVLWYSTISVGVIFLITPILDENKIANTFKTFFPKIIIPIILMMYISIYQRVNQYGITENRYYLIVLGLWVLGIMIYFAVKKPLKNIVIPISLSVIMLNSVYGPFSSFAISKYSQNKRFENILKRNHMISNGNIVLSPDITKDDKKEINNILSYFNTNHSIQDIKVLPKDFSFDKMENVFGFKYNAYMPYENNRYFYFGIYGNREPIDIKGFDYYINIEYWNEDKIETGGLTLQFNKTKNVLTISKDDRIILEQGIMEFVKDIYNKQASKEEDKEKSMVSYKDTTYNVSIRDSIDNIDLKFIFTNISGRIDDQDLLEIDNVEFILLISNKQ
ncbi:DUF4153 domain-containing protein [Tissierella pigra]|uniref:DUF4153 domain-containing protein n=1 Tax=Tissierella pigra TaxID=2607614 RepID=A0A6N7XMZ0_9FIRM|nr:DUF4153 domain-containing protein [Tissierella pigra]MBU5426347.1 DUF4153 domain-containing protein [Tissierella pigra]MSU02172.1 DUF4153 domain-containing protein [Tissierella pigra]